MAATLNDVMNEFQKLHCIIFTKSDLAELKSEMKEIRSDLKLNGDKLNSVVVSIAEIRTQDNVTNKRLDEAEEKLDEEHKCLQDTRIKGIERSFSSWRKYFVSIIFLLVPIAIAGIVTTVRDITETKTRAEVNRDMIISVIRDYRQEQQHKTSKGE